MYGVAVENFKVDDPKYFFSHEINHSQFTEYTIRNYLSSVNFPMNKLKQFKINDFLNVKIFARKKTPFKKSSSCVYSGVDSVGTVVIGNDCCYIDKSGSDYYIVCRNPEDYIFLVYKKITQLPKIGGFGIEIYNSKNEITFSSGYKACLLSRIIDSNSICNSSIIVNTPSAGYPRNDMTIENLLEINQNSINIGNGYCELGVTASTHNRWVTNSPLYPKSISAFYTIMVDSVGIIRYVPSVGIVMGQNDMIRGIRDFGGRQNMILQRNSLYIGVISH